METLRAAVRVDKTGWWEVRLLDLAIQADGATEAEMLTELRANITFEYHMALRRGENPFESLVLARPTPIGRAVGDGTAFRSLNLPQHIVHALDRALHIRDNPNANFGIQLEGNGVAA